MFAKQKLDIAMCIETVGADIWCCGVFMEIIAYYPENVDQRYWCTCMSDYTDLFY